MALYIHDFGDLNDSLKWDFNETEIPVYIVGDYPYKTYTKNNAIKLADIRKQIDKLCTNIIKNRSKWELAINNQEYLDGIEIFLGLHKEEYYDPSTLPEPFYSIALVGKKTSRYLLSEIPRNHRMFEGLAKPKMRYIDPYARPVGKDGKGRALYRDIFLNLNKNKDSLKKLVIHELAHGMANHIQWREDDHGTSFKFSEAFIKKYWID